MIDCNKIKSSSRFSCENQNITGTRRAWILNFNDIDSVVFSLSYKMVIENINLKAGKISYKIDGQQNSIAPKSTLIIGNFFKNYDHSVGFLSFDISPELKENIEGAKSGLFVVIVENVFKGVSGNTAFEVYGIDAGLRFILIDKDPNNQDTQGGIQFTLSTDKNKEPFGARTFFVSDYETTLALIEGLSSLPSDFNNDFNNDFN